MNTASASAATLLPSVARGSVSAFEEFYDRYAPTVYALLLRIPVKLILNAETGLLGAAVRGQSLGHG